MNRRQFLYGSAATALVALMPFRLHAVEGPVVSTARGRLRGLVRDGIHVFRGVPCGMPPYQGKYRLALPEFVPAWSGTIEATTPGDIPLQRGDKAHPVKGGGDCLRLNIWTPAPGKTGCPVMLYFPGGGSTRCDNNDVRYDGTSFARDGVVLVTANYRVNVDGFLRIDGVPANLALRDMMFSLRWVQENIAAFGGDPDNVTVFGQSAGATHITSLLASPLARGLFRRAILQSPSALAQYTPDVASAVAARLLDFYGAQDSRESVAAIPAEKLLGFPAFVAARAREPEWCRMLRGNMSLFKPYLDGEVLPERPVDAIAQGASRDVSILVGSTEEEWRWYTVPNGDIDRRTETDIRNLVESAGLAADIADRYRRAGRGSTTGDLFTALESDYVFRMPANKVLESHKQGGGTCWAYSMAWKSDAAGGRLGAAHGTDVPFVFGTLHVDSPLVRSRVGSNPPDSLADAMHGAWVRFASTGDPGWTPFDTARRMTMRFDTQSREVADPWKAERETMKLD